MQNKLNAINMLGTKWNSSLENLLLLRLFGFTDFFRLKYPFFPASVIFHKFEWGYSGWYIGRMIKSIVKVAQNSLGLPIFGIILQQARWCGCKTLRINL